MSIVKKEDTPEEKAAAKKEQLRLTTLLLKEQMSMVQDYRNTIKHTGGLLTKSMSFAYDKGIEAAFKLISKENEDVKEAKTEV